MRYERHFSSYIGLLFHLLRMLLFFLGLLYLFALDSREIATRPVLSKECTFLKECRSWFQSMQFIMTQRFGQSLKNLIRRGEIISDGYRIRLHSSCSDALFAFCRYLLVLYQFSFNFPSSLLIAGISFSLNFVSGSLKPRKQSATLIHSCRLVMVLTTVSACDLRCWKLN